MKLNLDSNLFVLAREYAAGMGLNFFDFRADVSSGLFLEATEGKIKRVTSPLEQGFGFRAFYQGAWGFAVTSVLKIEALQKTIDKATTLAKLASEKVKERFQITEQKARVDEVDLDKSSGSEEEVAEKISKVLEVNTKTKKIDPRIHNVETIFTERATTQWTGNSFGTLVRIKIPTFRFYNGVYAKEGSVLQEAFKIDGLLGNWGAIKDWDSFCSEPAQEALKLLTAKPAPAGTFTVIMDPKLTGTFIHEAFGHASEADAVVAKASVLEGRIGEQVAAPSVTIVDDGTLRGSFGYFPYDDEGTPSHCTTIVDKGVLTGYLTDLESASRLNMNPTGNGRTQSSQFLPQARMSATLLRPGDFDEEELIRETKRGILAIDWLYGYTDPVKGDFQFKTKGGYLIENGEKKELIRDVALSGLTLESLKNITGIARKMNYSPGTCGKGGQGVRVGDGAPHTRIENVKVGGLE